MRTVAALFVDDKPGGAYVGLPGVEVWGLAKDARLYAGPHPVICHSPCARWSRLAGLVQARWGHRKGDDDGCFESALASVRKWSGVLEHPAYSDAWAAFGMPRPAGYGGWQRGFCGGYSAYVEQGWYGHPAKKATWLYVFGVDPPELRWGHDPAPALVSWCGNHVASGEKRPRVGKAKAAATPPAFREVLLSIARSVRRAA